MRSASRLMFWPCFSSSLDSRTRESGGWSYHSGVLGINNGGGGGYNVIPPSVATQRLIFDSCFASGDALNAPRSLLFHIYD